MSGEMPSKSKSGGKHRSLHMNVEAEVAPSLVIDVEAAVAEVERNPRL